MSVMLLFIKYIFVVRTDCLICINLLIYINIYIFKLLCVNRLKNAKEMLFLLGNT